MTPEVDFVFYWRMAQAAPTLKKKAATTRSWLCYFYILFFEERQTSPKPQSTFVVLKKGASRSQTQRNPTAIFQDRRKMCTDWTRFFVEGKVDLKPDTWTAQGISFLIFCEPHAGGKTRWRKNEWDWNEQKMQLQLCCSAPEQLSKFLFYVCLLLCCTTQQPASQKTLQLLYTPSR